MDLKNIQICYCRNKESQSQLHPVSLFDWCTTDKFKNQIELIRATTDKTERDNLKQSLPCAMPSLLIDKTHSGFIAVDIDGTNHNENLDYTSEQLKQKVSSIVNVAYCGYSASGLGVWALIPLFDPTKHLEHFRALQIQFKHIGLSIDNSCSNVNRLRFASYDNEPYINPNAKAFSLILQEKNEPKANQENTYTQNADNVFENFNQNADVISLLENHGWKVKYTKGDRIYLQHPGKSGKGVSANFHTGLRLFTTWSSSTIFESRKAYNPSQIFHCLINSPNWKVTANELKKINL